MNTQIKTAALVRTPSRWKRLQSWVVAFEQATAYDPQIQAAATIRQLQVTVARLESRLTVLDGGNPDGTASAATRTLDRTG